MGGPLLLGQAHFFSPRGDQTAYGHVIHTFLPSLQQKTVPRDNKRIVE